jgi:hypothetical protein
MKNNDWLLGITAIGGILVAGYLYSENKRQMKVINELVDEREHLKFHFHFNCQIESKSFKNCSEKSSVRGTENPS